MEKKPFALIGINTNGYDVKKLKEVMEKENLPWRSFADAEPARGIFNKWNLQGTPTLYMLDHRGVIRHRWLGGPGDAVIDAAIAKLVKEAEGASP